MISGTCGTHVCVIPRRLKITREFREPQGRFPLSPSCLQHQGATVPLWSALSPYISLQLQPGIPASLSRPSRSHKNTSRSATSNRRKRSGRCSTSFSLGLKGRLESYDHVRLPTTACHCRLFSSVQQLFT